MTNGFELSRELVDAAIKLLDLPQEQIFGILGSQIYPVAWPGLVPKKDEKTAIAESSRRGKDWFEKHRLTLKRKICVEWGYCAKRKKYSSTREIIQAVAPVVGVAIGVSGAVAGVAVTVTALLMKMSLDSFCECE